MTNLTKAAREALEALEKCRDMMFMEAGCRWGKGDDVIATLRAALSEAPGEERDCRTCTRYTLHHRPDVPHCSSPGRCVAASRYERADYVQLWAADEVRPAMLAARPEAQTVPIGQVIDANRGANTGAAPETPMVVWFGQPAVGTHLYARPSAPTVALTEEQRYRCGDCRHADSWGIPQTHGCQLACHYEPLNAGKEGGA